MLNRRYPLHWPAGEPRTPVGQRRANSPFNTSVDKTNQQLYRELRRFHASNVVLSSNVPIRSDGMPYADAARRRMDDPGVALYFELGDRKVSIACDLYHGADDNMRAIFKIIEAMRTIERYGGEHLSQKSFTGFTALPAPKDVWSILGINRQLGEQLSVKMRREYVMEAFRDRARDGHGKGHDMAALVEARDQALQELGVTADG